MLETYIKNKYFLEKTGHDYFHIIRVRNLALKLCNEADDKYYINILALLHEELDDKLNNNVDINQIISEYNLKVDRTRLIKDIKSIGYKGGFVEINKSYEASIVSDADFLEAMGAIAVARTFVYNGAVKKDPIFNPDLKDISFNNLEEYRHKNRNAVSHFDEKLLKLKDLIVNEKAKVMANKRHRFMCDFLNEFYDEMIDAGMIDNFDRY